MEIFRNILTLVALLVFTAGSTGTPQLIHYCSDVPQTVSCDPTDCCDDAQETESDDCCSDEVTVQNIDDKAAVTPAMALPDAAPCADEAILPQDAATSCSESADALSGHTYSPQAASAAKQRLRSLEHLCSFLI